MASQAQSKSVTIQVATADLESLKGNGYKLCFAKKVNDTYNVIWQSSGKYLENNTFSWTPAYVLFGTNTFEEGVTVDVNTNSVSVGLGQVVNLDAAGHLSEAFDDPQTGTKTGITLTSEYEDKIHPGLLSVVTMNGATTTSAIYVADYSITTGTDVLTPIESVQVWFEQDIETSTMFSIDKSNVVEIDLTMTNTATRLYSNGKWTTPPSGS